MRRAAKMFSQIPGMSDRWATALDDWAERFFMVSGGWVTLGAFESREPITLLAFLC